MTDMMLKVEDLHARYGAVEVLAASISKCPTATSW